MRLPNFFTLLFLLFCNGRLFAQFLGDDSAPSLDEDFLDTDSATVFYLRYHAGYSAISTQSQFRTVVQRTFEKKFGAKVSLNNHPNSIANGVSLGVSGFRKLNRLFALGATLMISPVLTISSESSTAQTALAGGTREIARDAFVQSFYGEIVGECRFKIMLFDFGVGAQAQRIGDLVERLSFDENERLTKSETSERRAWTLSPTYFFAIGLDFFISNPISIVPMYRSFFWHDGGIRGSGDVFLLSLRTNF